MGAKRTGSRRGSLHADRRSLARAVAGVGGTHVALIADGSVDEWHKTIHAVGGDAPSNSYLVSVDDAVRGGASTASVPSTRRLGSDIVLATLDAPPSDLAESLRLVLSDALDDDTGGTVAVDDFGALVPDDADPMAVATAVCDVAAEFGVEFHTTVDSDGPALSALARVLPSADDDAEAALTDTLVAHLRESDPTNFGYLRRHWREARRGLTAVDMTYPQSKQIHAAIPDPETTTRTLGAALQALVKLGGLSVWGDTVAANRYDLTGYDPVRVDAIGAVLDDLDD